MKTALPRIILGLLLLSATFAADATGRTLVAWQPWTETLFADAQREDRLVILNLEAVWCHWCHVMDDRTYSNRDVADYLAAHYLAVRVDHDARPDLANRYRRYGWPATIIFAPDGTELVKRSGYMAPEDFLRLLEAVVADPTPEAAARLAPPEVFAESPFLIDDLRKSLRENHASSLDHRLGGLRTAQKFLDRDTVSYAMARARQGDADNEAWARRSIDASLALIDPVWGGAYQYSTHGDWDHPHFEKIMSTNAGLLRIYALAYAQWRDPAYLRAAQDIRRYLVDFLASPDGAFYTSQDADLVPGEHSEAYFALDDAARRARGLPKIDEHRYARENGWAAEALVTLHEVSGDTQALQQAETAVRWVVENRALPEGGFRHDAQDAAGPYLGDTLAMGRAFLALYRATAERHWLDRAARAVDFIDANFRQEGAGFLSGVPGDNPIRPVPLTDENVSAIRFANLLFHYTGERDYRELAEHGMRYLATPDVAFARINESGVLLAEMELALDPDHFTIIGPKNDALARELFVTAQREPGGYKRVEWWDTAEGALPNPDVQYPVLERPAAFICTHGRCSLPAFTPAAYLETIARIVAPAAP
ncbi:MAG: thioredoxin domain-containing protein [Gammaproteobacteria bacterium]